MQVITSGGHHQAAPLRFDGDGRLPDAEQKLAEFPYPSGAHSFLTDVNFSIFRAAVPI